MQMTQVAAAKLLEIDYRTMKRYTSLTTETPVPKAVLLALEAKVIAEGEHIWAGTNCINYDLGYCLIKYKSKARSAYIKDGKFWYTKEEVNFSWFEDVKEVMV